MTDRGISPNNSSKCKTKQSIYLNYQGEIQKKERLVVNKLGMKFDPVCWKKNHEKGRVQFVCIENKCNADRRLGCAHCIIDDHDQHVSNKITVEQYCDTFESNYKWFLFQVAKLEENYKKCQFLDIVNQIEKDLNSITDRIKQEINNIKIQYTQQIKEQAQKDNGNLIKVYQEQREIVSKMKEYFNKNLFEMTPAELEHSMILMGPTHIDYLQKQVESFDNQNTSMSKYVSQQWKIIKEQINNDFLEIVQSIQLCTLNFESPILINDTPANILETIKTQSQESQQQIVKVVQGMSTNNLKSPLRKVSTCHNNNNTNSNSNVISNNNNNTNYNTNTNSNRQISPNERYFVGNGIGKKGQVEDGNINGSHHQKNQSQSKSINKDSFSQHTRYASQQKIALPTCQHNPTERTLQIFNCCNQAFPCYECHDMSCNHKAHITVPSSRLCPICSELFSVNMLSTVDVKCYKCQ